VAGDVIPNHPVSVDDDDRWETVRTISFHHVIIARQQHRVGHFVVVKEFPDDTDIFADIHTQNRQIGVFAMKFFNDRNLQPARSAPRGPEVEQDRLSRQACQVNLLPGYILELEVRRPLTYQIGFLLAWHLKTLDSFRAGWWCERKQISGERPICF